jgi:hypothetical protein
VLGDHLSSNAGWRVRVCDRRRAPTTRSARGSITRRPTRFLTAVQFDARYGGVFTEAALVVTGTLGHF